MQWNKQSYHSCQLIRAMIDGLSIGNHERRLLDYLLKRTVYNAWEDTFGCNVKEKKSDLIEITLELRSNVSPSIPMA